jgi:alanyl-tRNA synthetase
MTERLYYSDAYLRVFDAHVLDCEPSGKRFAAQLDRTAFYPGGGGQLFDIGTLSVGETIARVLEVQADGNQIVHLLDKPLPAGERSQDFRTEGSRGPVGEVRGEIGWARRFDLTQQHTGQHILSQAFYQLCRAETLSVHMTENNCTLDLPRHLSVEDHYRAEELANRIVQENRPVTARFVDDAELSRIPLRKPPAAKHEKIRIVEVADFDWSACGGTHVRATGEVGMIKLIRAERRHEEQRIEFTCGMRAVLDYRQKNQSIAALASQLTVKNSDLAAAVQKLSDEAKETRRALNFARAQLMDHEADRLWSATAVEGPSRLIQEVLEGRTLDDARQLATRLKERPSTVVLFALAGDKPNLLFARSADGQVDMEKLLREVSAAFGGRGGGQPELAQGGIASGSDLRQALQMAADTIRRME